MPRALVLTAPHVLEVVERERQPLRNDEVRLRVDAAGICGSDVHGFAGVNDRRPVGVVMGHETIGRVIESNHVSLEIGDRVAVNPVLSCGNCAACARRQENLCAKRRLYGCCLKLDGGLSEEMVVEGENCIPVDPDANLRGLALIEPMSVGAHATRISHVHSGDRVLIVGGGPIGLSVALACAYNDADTMVCERIPERRSLAELLGTKSCRPDELSSREGRYDVAFECVGTTDALHAAVKSVRPGGTAVCLGIAQQSLDVEIADLVIQERRLLGASAYTAGDFVKAATAVTAKADMLAQLVQCSVGLDQMADVFADYHSGKLTAMKTIFLNVASSI